MDFREFWEISPYELSLKVNSYKKNIQYNEKLQLQTAYLTAYYQRVKKMPSLKDILKDDEPKKAKTPNSMLDMIKKMNSSFGGEVISGSN